MTGGDSSRRKRRVLLLLASILVPTILLVAFAARLVRQDAELARTRADNQRREAVTRLRRDLSAQLDAITLQEVNRWGAASESTPPRPAPDSPVVLVATVTQDRLLPPWAWGPRPAPFGRAFVDYQERAEAREFIDNDAAGALELFTAAHGVSSTRHEQCAARLWIGRNLARTGRMDDASNLWRSMIEACGEVPDNDGIAYGLYAAERLISTGLDRGEASTHVIESARRAGWRPPAQAHLLRSLVERVAGAATGDLRTRLAKEIHDIERIVDLANEFPALSRMETPFRTGFGKAWVGWGDEPWLVTLVSPAAFASPLVIAVSSSAVPSSEDAVLRGDPARGTPLGDGFVDVYVDWPPDRFAPERATPTAFYALGIGLILGVTALAGHLLLRDVNREVVTAEMRSQFVASVSHELKTPLTAIRMFAETLAAGRFHTESQRIGYLDTIRNESERLSRLVDNVLDFSRIERGKKIFHMETVALQPIVESAARAMRYPLEQKGFELAASIDASVPPIHADPDALEQAILNLLTNAMKYSGDSRYIGLDLRPEDHEAVLEVRDRGLGIAPEEHSRVFDKFYRVRSAELDRIAGAGLGLTLAVHIVKAHRGRIEVSSTPGEGSSFSIRLPLDQELPQ